MNLFIYIIGWNILLSLYGIFTALTAYYYYAILKYEWILYTVKIIELGVFIALGHHFLKRTTFEKVGVGKALIETMALPFLYFHQKISGGH